MVAKYRAFVLFAMGSFHIDSSEYLKESLTFSIMQPCQLDGHYIVTTNFADSNFLSRYSVSGSKYLTKWDKIYPVHVHCPNLVIFIC